MNSTLPAGTKLGRYQIRSLLGAGGMGEVYLADDTLLRRRTAIKLLTGDYTQNIERLHRFEREAYAASSLNHPNIVTIYEIGSEGVHHFIATEYVDGESLRDRARLTHMDAREIVDLAIQVASALTSAHDAGIIHRDIKPENIMLRRDGYVKVLDFGLAKLTDDVWSDDPDQEAATQLMIKTEPGRVMGTIDYMSPEQARGRDVDQRSDIFSLGVVLYELTARTKPFTGATKSDVLAAVLTAEAPPLVQRRPDVSAELSRIITKCLRKDPEERYQSTKELLVDLKSVRQELEFGAKVTTSKLEATQPVIVTPVTQPGPSYPTTISELFIKEVKTHPRRSFLIFVVIGLVAIAGALALYRLIKLAGRTDSFQNMRLTKLTSSGDVNAIAVAVSPDGKYVVYAVAQAGEEALWVRNIASTTNVAIVPPAPVVFTGLTFSADGSYLYYTIEEKKQFSSLYQVGVLGGTPRKIVDDATGPVTFSPDGARFAFRRSSSSSLMIANADGTGIKTLATRPEREIWLAPAWSPDRPIIVAGTLSFSDNKAYLVEVSIDDGKEKRLPVDPFLQVTSIAWLSDGSGLVLTARDVETKLFQVWYVGYPDGKARKVTNDLSSYAGVSLTADGRTLVSVQSARSTNLWVVPNGNAELASKITFETGKDEGLSGLSWTPDGRIVHTERTGGATDLWIVGKDGQNNTQLTRNAGKNFHPAVTADGRYIVFISDRAGSNDIWRLDLDGRNPVQLTNKAAVTGGLSVSFDSKWVFYGAAVDKVFTIWKVPIEGGPPIQLTHENSLRPMAGPRSDSLLCQYGELNSTASQKIAMISEEGGAPTRLLDLPNVIKSGLFQRDVKTDALIYRDSKDRIDNLWSQMLSGGTPKQLTDFKSDQIFAFDWSRDGKELVVARGRNGSDVVMITDFR
jgi:serine/threonine protein kinase/Tol biopolymer transport system component